MQLTLPPSRLQRATSLNEGGSVWNMRYKILWLRHIPQGGYSHRHASSVPSQHATGILTPQRGRLKAPNI